MSAERRSSRRRRAASPDKISILYRAPDGKFFLDEIKNVTSHTTYIVKAAHIVYSWYAARMHAYVRSSSNDMMQPLRSPPIWPIVTMHACNMAQGRGGAISETDHAICFSHWSTDCDS